MLLAHSDAFDDETGFAHLVHGDGEAEVYGVPKAGEALDALIFNHVSGDAFELIVRVARDADLVVLPVGCRPCVVAEAQRLNLPPELAESGVETVRSGRDLVGVIEKQ